MGILIPIAYALGTVLAGIAVYWLVGRWADLNEWIMFKFNLDWSLEPLLVFLWLLAAGGFAVGWIIMHG